MSDSDEFQKELDRIAKLQADVNNDSDSFYEKSDTIENNENNVKFSSDKSESDASKTEKQILEQNGKVSDSAQSSAHENDSDGSFSYCRNHINGKRVTRKATGSLPKETKTLLQETTEVLDEKTSSKKISRRPRPGFFNAIAPECTSCGSDVIIRPFQRRMLIHPYLKSVICRQCHEFYHSDIFAIDDEGSEIYCIWCGEGGELIYCDVCEKAFCSECIKRNFGKKVKNEIMSKDKWECFLCIPDLMKEHHNVANMVVKYQNLLIKDPLLVEKFECEVTKADMQKDDYESIVSERIRGRNTAKLLSSSQQKEESQKSLSDGLDVDKDTSGNETENGHIRSEDAGSTSDFSENNIKSKASNKKKIDKSVNPKISTDDSSSAESDDEKFIELIRKRAKNRKENTCLKKSDARCSSLPNSSNDKKTTADENDSSDDSLFDTGNTKVSSRMFRSNLDSSAAENDDHSDDENDEIVQKYREKLSKFKEISDKESEQSNFSSELSSSDIENGEAGHQTSSAVSKSTSDEEMQISDNSSSKGKAKNQTAKNKKKRKKKGIKETESEDEKPKRKKRRRKKKNNSEDSSSDEDDLKDKNGKSKRGKRKKIRKILGQNQLQKETIEAQEAEESRRQKVNEKVLPSQQGKIVNFILEDLRKEKYRSKPSTFEDAENGKVIEVHKSLKKRLKPHQLDGIQFMYDCCIESVNKVENGSPGSGCILAHCMGLGKTFQVITFLTTIMDYHFVFNMKRAIVVCPLNTVRNWKSEFDKWLKDIDDAPEVFVLSDNVTNNEKRAEILNDWFETSGVLVIGYSLYRILSQGSNIRKKRLKEDFKKCLVDPGPDIIVCDEGHILKNEKTGISKALNSIKTRRRVVLTGTPLQNNLIEYHCMVSFVKPNLLGTTREFKNMYENPINNGQCVDATEYDIRIMKERSHVLFEQLSACVQRRDYMVLKEFLPDKYEYVLSIKLSDLQTKLYQKFLDRVKGNGRIMSRLFESYQTLKKVWTHPWLLEIDALKNEKDSIDNFITENETSEDSWEASSDDSDFRGKKKNKKKKDDEKKEEPVTVNKPEVDSKMVNEIVDTIIPDTGASLDPNWFKGEMTDKDEKLLEHSGKLLVTLEILDKASQKGDKVLLFSQSLLALDFLETTINRVGWMKGRDYFRMDGSTKTAQRAMFQKKFNDKSNKRCRLFLISTKAGGLGINLVAANRIILFDMSWNPSDDTQSLFRGYRYGQTKNVYVYRLVARGTMEEKIYDRQVYKESLSSRVVDEKQISRYFSANDLQELFYFDPSQQTCTTSVLANHNPPADDVLASILVDLDPPLVLEYHEHDSLLEHRPDQSLTEEERKAAWANFKADKERRSVVGAPMGNTSVFHRLKAHTQSYQQPIITPIYSNQQELILGGFSTEQIISIQQQLAPVVQSGRLRVKALGQGQLHIEGLGPEQQQVFINSIKEQQLAQQQQMQAQQVARILPQQQILDQMGPAERAMFQQRLALLLQQQQQQQAQAQAQQQQAAMLQQQQVQLIQQQIQNLQAPATPPQPISIPDSPADNTSR